MKTSISELAKELNLSNVSALSEKSLTAVPVRNGNGLNVGDVITFDIEDEAHPGQAAAADQAIEGSENPNKIIFCTRNGKTSAINSGDLVRMCYRTSADGSKKFGPACEAVKEWRSQVRGLAFPDVMHMLFGKTIKVSSLESVERRKFGTDNEYEPFNVAIFSWE